MGICDPLLKTRWVDGETAENKMRGSTFVIRLGGKCRQYHRQRPCRATRPMREHPVY